jgi:hypothetical protein
MNLVNPTVQHAAMVVSNIFIYAGLFVCILQLVTPWARARFVKFPEMVEPETELFDIEKVGLFNPANVTVELVIRDTALEEGDGEPPAFRKIA